jgi:16S rRNA (uracil1498-N3)-methyltransferase
VTPAVPGGLGPHAVVDDLDAPALAPADRHHLERVRRLRAGDPLTVGDGVGGWRTCRFGGELEPTGAVQRATRPDPLLAVGFALVKGERPEWIVQKLTELGVDRIVPFTAERSVVRWDGDRARRHHERLVTIAREAAMQSGRLWLPQLDPPAPFEAVAVDGAVLADRGGRPPSATDTFVLVGPEGGWSASERANRAMVGLGGPVLRADTAAVVAGALLVSLRDGVVAPR